MGFSQIIKAQRRLLWHRRELLLSQIVMASLWAVGLIVTSGWVSGFIWLGAVIVGTFFVEGYNNHIGRNFSERDTPGGLELLLIAIWGLAPSLVFLSNSSERHTISVVMLACGFLIVLGRYRSSSKPAILITAPYAVLCLWFLYQTFGTGEFFYIAITAVILFGTFITMTAFSLKSQKNMEKQQDDMRALIKELKKARHDAEQSALFKSRFLANMSHEIRTPLNGIIGMTDVLRASENTDDTINELDIISDCGHTLLQLINDVLDLSKIEADGMTLDPQPFYIREEIAKISQIWHGTAKRKHIGFRVKIDQSLTETWFGDFNRIKQCLNNLLSNAVKFTDSGGVTLIVSQRSSDKKNYLIFKVLDTGIGLSSDGVSKLFEPFIQADETISGAFGGTGLGLSITKHFCDMMGGNISVSSEPGVGSCFEISFALQPIQSSEKPRNIDYISTSSQSKKLYPGKSCLVVDDIKSNRLTLKGILEDYGVTAHCASGGEEAYKMALEHRYDLIFMDVRMPLISGQVVTRRLRKARGYTQSVPIIGYTAVTDKAKIEMCYVSGMNDMCYKPVSSEKIGSVLKKYMVQDRPERAA